MFLALPLSFVDLKVGLTDYSDFIAQRLRLIAQCRIRLRNIHHLLCRPRVALPLYVGHLPPGLLGICVSGKDCTTEHRQP